MADTNMGDDELREELEKYGELVTKINDRTRPICLKKLNHFKAREAMASKENDRQKKSPGRTRHSTTFIPPKQEEDDELNEENNHEVHERQLRRRTVNLSRPAHVNNDNHDGRTRNRSPQRSRIPKSSPFLSKTPIVEVSKKVLPEKYPNPSFTELFHKRLTSGDSNAGQTPPRNVGFLNKFRGSQTNEKPDASKYAITRTSGERRVTEYSDSEGELNTSTKAINTTFPPESSFERSPPKFNQPPSYSSLRYPSGRSGFEQFQSKEVSKPRSSTFISKIVLGGVGLFFTMVALVYFYNAFIVTPMPATLTSRGTVCVTIAEKEICLNERERSALDDVVVLLAKRHGEVACGILRSESPDGFVAISELTNFLQRRYEDAGLSQNFEVNIENLLLLIQHRSDWNMSIRCRDPSNPSALSEDCQKSSIKNIFSLRSEKQALPLMCRIRRALRLVTLKIFLIVLSVLGLIGSIWLVVLLKKKKDKRIREVNSMANEIVGLLQNHASQCRNDSMVKSYLPVSHIRDALIPLPDRARKAHIWNDAVRQLAENETRIVQEIRDVAGEDTPVWRWNELTSIDLFGTKHPKEEKATKPAPISKFSSSPEMKRLNLLPFDAKLMSSCLKVYNILDSHSPNDYISEELRDSILDKCGQYHGILHIGCDYKIEEGVVFIKCVSESAANQNYKALHGWIYGDHLVSVKYVSPLVYKMIFADADNAMVPLKSSTHRRRF